MTLGIQNDSTFCFFILFVMLCVSPFFFITLPITSGAFEIVENVVLY